LENQSIAVDLDGKIAHIQPSGNDDDKELVTKSRKTLDCNGCFVMPGPIDCHVHVTAFTANFGVLEKTSPSYVTARALKELTEMLARSFTTIRDAGGADQGLARALEEGFCFQVLDFCFEERH
jgi:imidazolonepropionase-like amidohydrolase